MNTQDSKPDETRSWAEALQASNSKLRQLIEKSAWEEVRREINSREQLLHQILPALLREKESSSEFTEFQEIKVFLTDFLSVNQALSDHLCRLRGELDEKLKAARRGRKTLKLYKTPLPNRPRFFDRTG